ncbi:MAG: arginase family protein, partial [Thaumarchaeota archaeon]|nr:arginase family protein [Nitrososphaerota archaeon]
DIGNLAKVNDVQAMVDMVSKVSEQLFEEKQRFCMLGGEHSLTYGSFKNSPSRTALVVFDAHFDLRDEWEGSKLSHACYLRRAIEKTDPAFVAHIGGRAATADEWKLSGKLGLVSTPGEAGTREGVDNFARFCSRFDRFYVSVDIDGLDPAYAPGTGTPEPGGLTPSAILEHIYALKGKDIIAFDIMEVSPHYDSGITAAVAARFMNELIAVVAGRGK